jgi:hypothetical protein
MKWIIARGHHDHSAPAAAPNLDELSVPIVGGSRSSILTCGLTKPRTLQKVGTLPFDSTNCVEITCEGASWTLEKSAVSSALQRASTSATCDCAHDDDRSKQDAAKIVAFKLTLAMILPLGFNSKGQRA